MGIYDRDYIRSEKRGFIGAMGARGQVTKWLVMINVIVYIVQLLTNPPAHVDHGWFTDIFIMKPDVAFEGLQVWRLLTGAFLHDPHMWTHIVWNMLFLFFFGPDMEDIYGHREFAFFYLAGGIVGNFLYGVTTLWEGPVLLNGQPYYIPALGASGAVLAVMVLCALHYPRRTILIWFVLPVPLWLWVVILVAADLYTFINIPGATTGVAVAAHLGGAGFGFLYYRFQWRLSGFWSRLMSLRRRASRPRLRVYRETPVASGPRDEQLEAKADAILAKVHQRGMASLSDQERDILKRASEQFKKRRT